MNDELVFSSSETTPVTSSDDALQDLGLPNCEIFKCYTKKHGEIRHKDSTRNAINLEDLSMTYIETSDDEKEDTSEQLSADFEQPANRLVLNARSFTDCKKELASVLRERVQRLRLEMTSLREELNKETVLWQEEKEEFLREQSDALAFEEATAAARAAAAAYAIESPLSSDLSKTVDVMSEQSVKELAMFEYEKDFVKYQDPCSVEQAEQRYNAYKRALVEAYQQKLLEVERLCNEELERIRESASYLQSFKEIASQWSVNENDRGDASRKCNEQIDAEQPKIVETHLDKNNWYLRLGKVNHEVCMSPEMSPVWLK